MPSSWQALPLREGAAHDGARDQRPRYPFRHTRSLCRGDRGGRRYCFGGVCGAGAGVGAGADTPLIGSSLPLRSPISGTSCLIAVASWIWPRGANARFSAGRGGATPPPGGPPQTPRRGLAHAILPVQRWRMM